MRQDLSLLSVCLLMRVQHESTTKSLRALAQPTFLSFHSPQLHFRAFAQFSHKVLPFFGLNTSTTASQSLC